MMGLKAGYLWVSLRIFGSSLTMWLHWLSLVVAAVVVLIGYSHNSDPSKGSDQKSSIAIVTALVDCISQ